MAITSQLEIAKKTLKSLFPVNIETGAVGSGEGAWLLSVPRSSVHWVRVGQGPAVLAVDVGGVVCTIFLSSIVLMSPSLSKKQLDKD